MGEYTARMRLSLPSACATVLATCMYPAAANTQERASADWTILVYGAVDNDWERPFMRDVRHLRQYSEGIKGVEIVLLIDRSPRYSSDTRALGEDFSDTRLYRLTGGRADRLDGRPGLPSITRTSETELNSADPATLRGFIQFGKKHFPARHTAVFVVSHGEGMNFCPDETGNDSLMYPAQITDVLTSAESVDLFGIDACLMAGIENAYQWRKPTADRAADKWQADVLIAAAPVSSAWPYREILQRMGGRRQEDEGPSETHVATADPKTMDARAFGSLIIEELKTQIVGGRSGDEGLELDLQSWGAFDLSHAASVKSCVDALAVQLWKDDAKNAVLNLRGSGLDAETIVYVWPERGSEYRMPHVDLYDLCRRIAASTDFSDEARKNAGEAALAVDDFVINSFGLSHYEEFVPGRGGIYVTLPDGNKVRKERNYWELADWYAPGPCVVSDAGYGRYAWCADGAQPANGVVENWFEMLDAWFDPGPADLGGSNGYAW